MFVGVDGLGFGINRCLGNLKVIVSDCSLLFFLIFNS